MGNTTEHISLTGGWEASIYREWDFPPDVIERWDVLSGRLGDVGIFVGFRWFDNWWRAFGRAGTLFVVILMKDGLIRAIFPCCFKDYAKGATSRCIASLTNDYTYYYDFIIDPEDRKAALVHFIRLVTKKCYNVQFFFEYMETEKDNFMSLTDELRRRRVPLQTYSNSWAPWMSLSSDLKKFQESLPRKRKSDMLRCRKRAEERGKLTFEVIRHSEQLDSMLDMIFEVEYKSWKGRDGTAIKCIAEVESFFRGIARWAMDNNHLHIFILKLADTPISVNFCLNSGSTLFGLKQGYDESFRNVSPGYLLFWEIFDYLFRTRAFSKYNFFGACEPWKMEWTRETHDYSWIKVYPNSLKGRGRYFLDYGWKNQLGKITAIRKLKSYLDKKNERDHGV